MEILYITFFLSAFFTLWLGAAWLDKKHSWQLVEWMNGQCNNPFSHPQPGSQSQTHADKDNTIAELKARIEVLEKLVTEPAYELNKKINQL